MGHSKKIPTFIAIAFNQPLNTVSATNLALYRVFAAVKKRGMTVFSKALKIKSVSYPAGSQTVTLNLAKSVKGKMQVTIQPGLTGANGASTDTVLTQTGP